MTVAKLRSLINSIGLTIPTKYTKVQLIDVVIGKATKQPVGGQHTRHVQHPVEPPLSSEEEKILESIANEEDGSTTIYEYKGEIGNGCFIHQLTRHAVGCLLNEPRPSSLPGELNDEVSFMDCTLPAVPTFHTVNN